MTDFDTAFERLIGNEGGYTNNPADPGGETKFGISKRAYPDVEIASLTMEQAKALYLRDFWNPLADAHPAIKFQVFDFAVNAGMQTAIRKLQSAIGVADDGHWGAANASTLAQMDVNDVLVLFAAERLNFYTSLTKWDAFGKGWARRIANDLKLAAQDN
jgi:lysozyme family protein